MFSVLSLLRLNRKTKKKKEAFTNGKWYEEMYDASVGVCMVPDTLREQLALRNVREVGNLAWRLLSPSSIVVL